MKPNYDENYFENIDTPAKAYFLGLMYADGYISHTNYIRKDGTIRICYIMSISLQEKDKTILEKFREELKRSNNLLYTKSFKSNPNRQPQYCLSISGKKIYDDYIYKDCEDLYIPRKKEKFEEIICALNEKSLSELGLIAGKPEMVISSQAVDSTEGSSTIPEMEVESSDSKCPTPNE